MSDELLDFDPLDEAEKITGKRYAEDDETMALGFLMMQEHARHKQETLSAESDTHSGLTWEGVGEIVRAQGFESVYEREWSTKLEGYGPERAITYWREDGLLVDTTSFCGRMNSADLYGNVEFPLELGGWSRATSSGHFNDESWDEGRRVWIGHWDVREGLKRKLSAVREVGGTWLETWVERPFISLDRGRETEALRFEYYRERQDAALLALPESVRSRLGVAR